VITIHQRYRQTDRQTTCDRNTALCTKVHRAVKILELETSNLLYGFVWAMLGRCTNKFPWKWA